MLFIFPPRKHRAVGFLAFVLGLMPLYLSAQPLNGSYTIGGSSPNYATLTAAVASLTTNGVSGPVVFNIASGTYQEQASIPAITGASAANTITFQSAALDSTATIFRHWANSETDNYVFELNGASYIRIQYLTLEAQSLSHQKALRITGDASYNVFTHNVFRGDYNGANDYHALVNFNAWSTQEHNSVSYNRFEGGGYQLLMQFLPGLNLDNEVVGNEFTGNYSCAISIYNQEGIDVRENTITGTTSYPGAIELNNCTGSGVFEKNKINVVPGMSVLLRLDNVNSLVIRNNFFAGSWIAFSQVSDIKFYNNSCYFPGTMSGGLSLEGSENSVAIFNNVISSPGTGSFIRSFPSVTTTGSIQCDYNLYYTEATENFAPEYGISMGFAEWQSTTGFDSHSLVSDPLYFSTSNLHINNSLLLDGAGTPLPEVTYDIDGETRDPLNPDIGADEYAIDMMSFRDLEMVGGAFTTTPCTPASSVKVRVANHSAIPINSFTIVHRLFGQVKDSAVYTVTLQPDDTAIVDLGAYAFTPGTLYNYDFKVLLPDGLPDNYANNNTGSFSYSTLGNVTIRVRAQQCAGDMELFVSQQPLGGIQWSTGATTPSITATVPGIYSVVIIDTNGCTVMDSYTIN